MQILMGIILINTGIPSFDYFFLSLEYCIPSIKRFVEKLSYILELTMQSIFLIWVYSCKTFKYLFDGRTYIYRIIVKNPTKFSWPLKLMKLFSLCIQSFSHHSFLIYCYIA